jgi:hypothetical protein
MWNSHDVRRVMHIYDACDILLFGRREYMMHVIYFCLGEGNKGK